MVSRYFQFSFLQFSVCLQTFCSSFNIFSHCLLEIAEELCLNYRSNDLRSHRQSLTPRRSVGGNRHLKRTTTEGILGKSDQVWVYGSQLQTHISMMDRLVHPSLLTESSPNTHLKNILSVRKQKPSTDRCALNVP